MKYFFLFAGFLSCLACSNRVSSSSGLAWLDGRWRGVGFDVQEEKTWSIRLEANSRRKRYEVEYPSEKCSGTWQLLDSDGCKLRFAETIGSDPRNHCVNGTLIITRLDERTVTYTWYKDEKPVASAFLTRE